MEEYDMIFSGNSKVPVRTIYRLVAGYVNRTETLEHAAVRELKEETGMTANSVRITKLIPVHGSHLTKQGKTSGRTSSPDSF
jgi:NADH pyrophosphatase NudC (nudix superfamily)